VAIPPLRIEVRVHLVGAVGAAISRTGKLVGTRFSVPLVFGWRSSLPLCTASKGEGRAATNGCGAVLAGLHQWHMRPSAARTLPDRGFAKCDISWRGVADSSSIGVPGLEPIHRGGSGIVNPGPGSRCDPAVLNLLA